MADSKTGGRRRRSSSILQVYHEPPETIEQINDQAALPNLNANWTNAKGAWTIHIVLIACLKIFFDVIPGVSQETSWTLTNITYMCGSYIMFHYVRGVPFEFNSGAFDNLNMWEQNRQRGPVHAYQKVPSERPHCSLSPQHSLYTL